ncbi:class I SAM-dependent methyltransferase [Echinicola sp. 20G]|uniref:class I SAM-dependent methyltransferase n=1 Tax=Echinicola sp. 20G TaxID=2781961 RepID=UPI0019100E35|nr:class I SAM-dependent methyltransferase [Echinicola sp. 20G]
MKDNFSGHASEYEKFRPTYPENFYAWLISQVKTRKAAWDCGTGNGQVASILSNYFERVEASDISEQQMAQAPWKPNVYYTKCPAEKSGFSDHTFDLITVAQAVHWFDFDPFFKEVNRTLKPNGVIALIGYGLMDVPDLDKEIKYLYADLLGDFWDPERKHIEEAYESIPFQFEELATPQFSIEESWSLDELLGYLNTWSAVKHYIKENGTNPVDLIEEDLRSKWGAEKMKPVSFPLILRVGINKL